MKKWEYLSIDRPVGGHSMKWLDEAGNEGWELVAFDSEGVAWMKREVVEPAPEEAEGT